MNIKSKLTLGLGLIAVPLALRAIPFDEAYLEHYRTTHNPGPVPIAIVVPKVGSEFVGKEIELQFVVDPSGHPTQIKSATPGADPRLVEAVADAVAWWQFYPAYRDGRPVARKVELPVSVVAQKRGR